MIGGILNKTRKLKGITAQQMADHLDMGLRAYRNYESNDRQPSLETLVKIANKLDVTTDYLLDRTSEYDLDDKKNNLAQVAEKYPSYETKQDQDAESDTPT